MSICERISAFFKRRKRVMLKDTEEYKAINNRIIDLENSVNDPGGNWNWTMKEIAFLKGKISLEESNLKEVGVVQESITTVKDDIASLEKEYKFLRDHTIKNAGNLGSLNLDIHNLYSFVQRLEAAVELLSINKKTTKKKSVAKKRKSNVR